MLYFSSFCGIKVLLRYDSVWLFSDEYGWFQTSYSYWFLLDSDWLWVVSGGNGWFWGIADSFGWMVLGGCGWFRVVSGGFGWFRVVCCFSSYGCKIVTVLIITM